MFLKLKNQDKFNLSNKKAGLREEIIIIACSAYYSFIIRFAYWRPQAIHWRPQTFHWRPQTFSRRNLNFESQTPIAISAEMKIGNFQRKRSRNLDKPNVNTVQPFALNRISKKISKVVKLS